MSKFASEGFDLDAGGASGSDDVVYEIGGGVTAESPTEPAQPREEEAEDEKELTPEEIGLKEAQDYKQQGNDAFKQGDFLEAYDMYTLAIEKCPFPVEHEELATIVEEAIRPLPPTPRPPVRNEKEEKDSSLDEAPEQPDRMKPFREHSNSKTLSVYYCNRAATAMKMDRYKDAVGDCDISSQLDPQYVKAFARRSAAYEKLEQTDEALRDAKQAQVLDPGNLTIRRNVERLQKIEDERLEKLKAETIGKLKIWEIAFLETLD